MVLEQPISASKYCSLLNLTQCEQGCFLEHLAFFLRHGWQLDLASAWLPFPSWKTGQLTLGHPPPLLLYVPCHCRHLTLERVNLHRSRRSQQRYCAYFEVGAKVSHISFPYALHAQIKEVEQFRGAEKARTQAARYRVHTKVACGVRGTGLQAVGGNSGYEDLQTVLYGILRQP